MRLVIVYIFFSDFITPLAVFTKAPMFNSLYWLTHNSTSLRVLHGLAIEF